MRKVKKRRKIMCVVGTRPEFIRMALIIGEVRKNPALRLQLIHTGQHYNFEMDDIFFQELALPEPDVNLGVGSGSHGWQTAQVMIKMEESIKKFKPDLAVVFGDTNSSLGAALAAAKMNIPLAHIEAGCRSYDMTMAEEINRRLIDHCSDILFPVSEHCQKTLEKEKVPGRIFQLGDPLCDVFLKYFKKTRKQAEVIPGLNLEKDHFAILTLHRAENVDNPKILKNIVSSLTKIRQLPIIFPTHPRTVISLKKFKLWHISKGSNLKIIKPVGYWDFLRLLRNAQLVVTDSGGVQKEAMFAAVPCITLRKSTEWIETVKLKVNFLVDPENKKMGKEIFSVLKRIKTIKRRFSIIKNPYGNGQSASKIVKVFSKLEFLR